MKALIRGKNKYATLYGALMLFMLLAPFMKGIKSPLVPLFFFGVILSVLRLLNLQKIMFRLFLGLALIAFASDFIATRIVLPITGDVASSLKLISAVAYLFFLAGAIRFLLIKIFLEEHVTTDTIKGGIAVYFMIGIFWALLYGILFNHNPRSLTLEKPIVFIDLLYFSFTTLTTLGYGDIAPSSGVARNLAVLEAVFGQLYVAILVARIVGLHSMKPPDA
jgi:uncharacterized membrane protein